MLDAAGLLLPLAPDRRGWNLEVAVHGGRGTVPAAAHATAGQRGWPQAITVDNGTEFTSKALDDWAYRRGIKLDYTRPGKPTDNELIESFNGRLRDEFLKVNEFVTMSEMHEK